MEAHTGHVLTLANSIIGVSILAMPYCFKQCGIVLAVIILLFSNLISRLSCHFLIKSAVIARRKTFEYLAYYIFGGLGKFIIEVGMIGFLIGTCIAFFVVIGDLGPEIISEITGQDVTSTMRSSILLAIAVFCVLPLGLLKNVDSLTGVAKVTIGFYVCLVLKIITDAVPLIFNERWIDKVELWRPAGIIQCLPIFSMALSCQTQLFEIYQVVHNPSLEKMNNVIKNAVNMCTLVYFLVGFFGYIAFVNKNFSGNILLSFSPSMVTNIIKVGFILSIAFSFPLVIFPCRASIHSLIYKQGITIHEGTVEYIPEGRFKALTVIIVFISLIIGILIPNIEFVLGLVGSSIGIMICILFPVTCFIYISTKDTNERLLAKLILVIGLILMILGTYENLHNIETIQSPIVSNVVEEKRDIKLHDPSANNFARELILNTYHVKNNTKVEGVKKLTDSPEIRHEPPQPVEPQEAHADKEKKHKDVAGALDKEKVNQNIHITPENKLKNDEVDIEAIKKDDSETNLQEEQKNHLEEHKILIDQIQKQNEVQEEIVKQQGKIIEVFAKQQQQKDNEEKLKAEIKAVKEIESIALKAIEKISGDVKQNEKILEKVRKDVFQKVNASVKLENTASIKNQSQENIRIEELKLMNSLLKEKIKQNNVTQKSTVTSNNNFSSNQMLVAQNITKDNTAPLLINLGQKTDDVSDKSSAKAREIVQLPLVVSLQQLNSNLTNVKANVSRIENLEINKNNRNSIEGEAKFMRRDILEFIP